MKLSEICIISVKVLAAVSAGVAIFIGLNKTFDKQNQVENRPDDIRRRDPTNIKIPNEEVIKDENTNKSQEVVGTFKKFQNTCGKLFSVAQSLSTVAENLYRIFNNKSSFNQDNYSYGNSYDAPQGFRRISPYIIEAGYNPDACQPSNRYYF